MLEPLDDDLLLLADAFVGLGGHGGVVEIHALGPEVGVYAEPHRGAATPDGDGVFGPKAAFVDLAAEGQCVHQKLIRVDVFDVEHGDLSIVS